MIEKWFVDMVGQNDDAEHFGRPDVVGDIGRHKGSSQSCLENRIVKL